MLWSNELSGKEKKYVNPKYIFEPKDGQTECIKTAVEYFGIEIKVVLNYYDAIQELTKQTTQGFCDYYATWVICGPPYPILPQQNNPHADPNLVGQFIDVLILYWQNGGSIVFWAEGDPLHYQVNLFLQKARFKELEDKCSELRIGGEHKGGKILFGDETGGLSKPQSFNRNPKVFKEIQRFPLAHNLGKIFEGITISYVQDESKMSPFIPFSRDSSGGISSLFYPSHVTCDYGDIIIDCGFTKCFTKMNKDGTFKYIQNIAGWTARPEVHSRDKNIKPKYWRPKAVIYTVHEGIKWNGFSDIIKHRLFAIDCSGSVRGNIFYHSELRKIIENEYKPGDKIFIWSNLEHLQEKTRSQMEDFMNNKYGNEGTYSDLIADIVVTAGENYHDHLIIVTDGEVPFETVQAGDEKMKANKIKFKHVTTYLINNKSNEVNLSVGAPYSRSCPNETYLINAPDVKQKQVSLMKKDLDALNEIGNISTYQQFIENYKLLEEAIQAKTVGTKGDGQLQNDLDLMKQRIMDSNDEYDENEFQEKWNVLFNMASGAL
ncbi:hypothetical protein GPJ56_006102 [Histomonas meleagridis]|nr:hypothetical protein GPJ56_006102 [Histomonas meleagridis]